MHVHNDVISDVLIIGSGAAGLSLALRLPDTCRITLLSKNTLDEGSTLYAQGGIAAVFDADDSVTAHIEDTLLAGAGLCQREAVAFVAENARHCIEWLVGLGVKFDLADGAPHHFHLTQEGGHRHRRIVHYKDATGRAVATTLTEVARQRQNIRSVEHVTAIDILLSSAAQAGTQRAVGALVWDKCGDRVSCYRANIVVLATGGAANVYRYSTNPPISTGDGVAMAWRAGCQVANMEFNQFHPTTLYHPQAHNFLLSEALRGEGAILRRPDGSAFMRDHDARAELAPRDIVTRAIVSEMQRLDSPCMYLDISHRSATFITQHFPAICRTVAQYGLDLTCQPMPIVPAAHYTCGGVVVNQHAQTSIDSLYAVGEVSYTGLHGANRMASNSLLECLVYAWSASMAIAQALQHSQACSAVPLSLPLASAHQCTEEQARYTQRRERLRAVMWEHVGIARTVAGLNVALQQVNLIHAEVEADYHAGHFTGQLFELRNLAVVAQLVIKSALARKESRGLHYNVDFPQIAGTSEPTILTPNATGVL